MEAIKPSTSKLEKVVHLIPFFTLYADAECTGLSFWVENINFDVYWLILRICGVG